MISIAIMAHGTREARARALAAELDAPIVWDRRNEEWDTGRRALLGYDRAADYHAVIQDDAIVGRRFREALELAAANAGGCPLGLYIGRVRPRARLMVKIMRAVERAGASWIEAPGPWWGVGVAFPTGMIPELVAEADTYRHPHYDYRLTRAVKVLGRWCRYPVPSLVDHDPELPSLLDHAGGDRRAHRYLGDDDPAEIDWTRDPVFVDQRGRINVRAAV